MLVLCAAPAPAGAQGAGAIVEDFTEERLGAAPTSFSTPTGFWFRWSGFIQRHPWPSAAVGLAIMLVLVAPVVTIRLGSSDAGTGSGSCRCGQRCGQADCCERSEYGQSHLSFPSVVGTQPTVRLPLRGRNPGNPHAMGAR